MGERVKDGTILEATEPLRSGETFSKREERTLSLIHIYGYIPGALQTSPPHKNMWEGLFCRSHPDILLLPA